MMRLLDWFRRKGGGEGPCPGGIDCGGVVERLYEYIDGELTDPNLVEQIRSHLELCEACYPHYDFERAFLRFLAEHGRSPAPPELRRKVFQRILAEEHRG